MCYQTRPGDFLHTNAVLAMILIVGALLRFWNLDRHGFWLDEAVSMNQVAGSFIEMIVLTSQDNYPPLHNIILWLTTHMFGHSEWIARFPSALIGVATVLLLFHIGRTFWTSYHGLTSAGLAAVLPLLVWHSTEARMYAVTSFTATLFIWAMLSHFRQQSRFSLVFSSLATVLLLMSHIYGSLAVFSVVSVACFRNIIRGEFTERVFLSWITAQIVAATLFLPWAFALFFRTDHVLSTGFWIQEPNLVYLIRHLGRLISPQIAIASILIFIIWLFFNFRGANFSESRDQALIGNHRWYGNQEIMLLIAMLVGPFFIGYCMSIFKTPMLHSKYLLVSIPALLIIFSLALYSLPLKRRFALYLSGMVALMLFPSASYYAMFRDGERHDMRAALAFIDTQSNGKVSTTLIPRYMSHFERLYGGNIPFMDWNMRLSNVDKNENSESFWLVARSSWTQKQINEIVYKTETKYSLVIDTQEFHGLRVFLFEPNQH